MKKAILAFLSIFFCANLFAQPDGSDIDYGVDVKQKLNYYTASQANTPLVIVIHGGSWSSGDKNNQQWMLVSQMFSDSGYAVINTNYRLSSQPGYTGFPSQVEDIACVISWAKTNYQLLNADTGKIVLFGFSAGAHLASLTGLWQSSSLLSNCSTNASLNLAGVVSLSGIYSFDSLPAPQLAVINQMLVDANQWDIAQPINHIDNSTGTAFLIMHGEIDTVASNVQAVAFYDSLITHGYCARIKMLDARGHDLMSNPSNDTSVFNGVFGFVDSLVNKDMCVVTTGIDEEDAYNFKLFPNPVVAKLNVETNYQKEYDVTISNANGQILLSKKKTGNAKINLSNLSSGIYFVKFDYGNYSIMKKILKH